MTLKTFWPGTLTATGQLIVVGILRDVGLSLPDADPERRVVWGQVGLPLLPDHFLEEIPRQGPGLVTSLLDAALPLGVKPFSALITLFCKAGREYFGRDDLRYNYSADARDAMGTPKALFNCVASFQRPVTVTEADTLATLVPGVEADIRHNLTKEPKLFRVAEQMGWVYQVYRQRASLKIKKRVFQMGEYISGFPSDFWVSYQGDPFVPADPDLEKYLTDFQTWVPADGASIGVECTTLHGVITICIQNKAQKPGYAAALRHAFESAGVKVLEAAELGPSPYTSPYIP